ncbi:nuclear transport factor 2 family protein [Mangrovimonas sp. DI 80]|uniref:nuclear transport factor 2 family protein n=1 Tax=Mangrovimonas sp. DI 80 TaxID=1779330 RepID=UPI000976E060|nr:nuclear transport factor 2 family protein [Mangrovimonas sp. DI 80]OMP32292.1 hypothetical protein BKM32_04370 [Mangrovimonas sp. DI 80]
MKHLVFLFGWTLCSAFAVQAQNDLDVVKREIESLSLIEQQAFKEGDCETVMSLMDADITFYANGNPSPPKSMIATFCEKIPRPFPEPSSESLTVYPLTTDSAYVVRILAYDKNEQVKIKEVVTKIWKKLNGKWKIVHLQSTVKEFPKSK